MANSGMGFLWYYVCSINIEDSDVNNHNNTIKWIGIIALILVTIGGWFFAGIQLSASHRIEELERINTEYMASVITLRLEQGIIIEQIKQIRLDIADIKTIVAKQ